MSSQTVITDRLILKPLSEEYFPDFFEMDQDPEVMHFLRKPSQNETEGRERFNKYFAYMEKNPGHGLFAVIEKSTQSCVGLGILVHIEMKHPEWVEVGYRFKRAAWGKGYATEVAKSLIKYGFEVLKLKEIYGTTHPDHTVSQKALMKAGLSYVGKAEYYNGSKIFRIVN